MIRRCVASEMSLRAGYHHVVLATGYFPQTPDSIYLVRQGGTLVLKRELDETFSGASFLPRTTLDSRCMAGLQWWGKTILAVGSDFMEAYHRLWRRCPSPKNYRRRIPAPGINQLSAS